LCHAIYTIGQAKSPQEEKRKKVFMKFEPLETMHILWKLDDHTPENKVMRELKIVQ
jgi:hypothetical protein